MNINDLTQEVQSKIKSLIDKSQFSITENEYENIVYYDFNLGRFLEEGVSYIDILKTEQLRITLLILLPNQTLPEHHHPSYHSKKGKEETIRVLYGQTRVYIDGEENSTTRSFPNGQECFYTAKHEIILNKDQQFTLVPGIPHWFQGGLAGSVNLEFQNAVNEQKNIFTNPAIKSPQIK